MPARTPAEQNQITSREDRDLEPHSKEQFIGGVYSMQELNTPTVVRCRNFSNHTDKLDSPLNYQEFDSNTLCKGQISKYQGLRLPAVELGAKTQEENGSYIKRSTLFKTGQLPLWSPMNHQKQRANEQDQIPKMGTVAKSRPRLYSDTQLLIPTTSGSYQRSEEDFPKRPPLQTDPIDESAGLESSKVKRFTRSSSKKPTKHRRKASEAIWKSDRMPDQLWTNTPQHNKRTKVQFATLGPCQSKLVLPDGSNDCRSDDSELQRRPEGFQP